MVESWGVLVSTKNMIFDRLWRVERGVNEMIRNSIGFGGSGEETRRLGVCVGLLWVGGWASWCSKKCNVFASFRRCVYD